ncbi:MAG: group III truncated hemoglobin [Phycisphaerales bacterium JB059]
MTPTDLPISSRDPEKAAPDREGEIARLVERFYEVARLDPDLGPIFERHVADWDRHLATMRDFWSAAVYRTGRYSGRPLEVHRRVGEIREEHFPRWLRLWERTVDEVVRSEARGPLKVFAARMASAMSTRMGPTPGV